MLNAQLTPATSQRLIRALALRTHTAGNDAFAKAPAQVDNGDDALYADKSGTYTKGVLQSGIGLVDLAAYQSFKKALASGTNEDFEKITLGGPRKQNGPQGGLSILSAMSRRFSVFGGARTRISQRGVCNRTRRAILGLAVARRCVYRLSHQRGGNTDSGRTLFDACLCRSTNPQRASHPPTVVPWRVLWRKDWPIHFAVPAKDHSVRVFAAGAEIRDQ